MTDILKALGFPEGLNYINRIWEKTVKLNLDIIRITKYICKRNVPFSGKTSLIWRGLKKFSMYMLLELQ